MSINPKSAYRRILLKLSGEALMGDEGFGIDPKVLERLLNSVFKLVWLSEVEIYFEAKV
jgi:uridylate kinase